MGRKAINKKRKPLNTKQQKWLGEVLPYFYKNGMRKPTMDDIAEQLNLTKATIYNYYSSKEDLIHDALWFKLVELQKFEIYYLMILLSLRKDIIKALSFSRKV